MHYEEAVKEWGARLLERGAQISSRNKYEIDRSTVNVEFTFNEGFPCCGGLDPSCYCSFAESPSARVEVTGKDTQGVPRVYWLESYEFDFAKVIKELVSCADGKITD